MRSNSMPGWLKVLLAVLGVVVLGPPALVLLMVALGLALKASVIALKVLAVVAVVAVVVAGLRALFGGSPPEPRRRLVEPSIEELAAKLEAEEAERRMALDLELARSLSQSR